MGADAWEDVCQNYGFEWIDFEAKGRNEFAGEFEIFFDFQAIYQQQSGSSLFFFSGEVEGQATDLGAVI